MLAITWHLRTLGFYQMEISTLPSLRECLDLQLHKDWISRMGKII
nr:hypothetical protein Iba_scaffold8000.4CG1600 [Ipomoea batatas]